MKIGYTLDEKILDVLPAAELLAKTREMGISSIEVSPDESIMAKNVYLDIARLSNELSMEINYHVPYFADNFLYEIMNFKEYPNEVKSKYEALISIISDIQNITCRPSILTLHGASISEKETKDKSLYNTLSFHDWLLNFLDKKNIDLKLALETLNKNEDVVGGCREDIMYIINEFKNSKLGICWDICHDAVNYYPGKMSMHDEFFENIIYCHIHGFSIEKNKSHISLRNSDIKFDKQLKLLSDKGYKGIINLELLVKYCGDNYLENLYGDIDFIKYL